MVLMITNDATRMNEMPCTTAKSLFCAAPISADPSPFRLKAISTTESSAISDAMVSPATVVIGIAALRSTWRRTTVRHGMPRLMAVCTCSWPISSRTAVRVTLATSAIDEKASANAGSVKCLN